LGALALKLESSFLEANIYDLLGAEWMDPKERETFESALEKKAWDVFILKPR
jgi:hypothetical protein